MYYYNTALHWDTSFSGHELISIHSLGSLAGGLAASCKRKEDGQSYAGGRQGRGRKMSPTQCRPPSLVRPTHYQRSAPHPPTRPPAQLPRPHASFSPTSLLPIPILHQKKTEFEAEPPKSFWVYTLFKEIDFVDLPEAEYLTGNVSLFHEEQWWQQGGFKKKSRGERQIFSFSQITRYFYALLIVLQKLCYAMFNIFAFKHFVLYNSTNV